MNKSILRVARIRLPRIADFLLVGIAISLPWSTTATAILITLWLCVLLPTLSWASVRQELFTPAGGAPVLLWLTALLGVLWSEASFSDRLHGLGAFHKLLVLPILFVQCRRSDIGLHALKGFYFASIMLLIVSWILALLPGLDWRGKQFGVPVKDYISQSGIFVLCAFALLSITTEKWQDKQRVVFLSVAALMLANVVYIAASRTALVVMAVLAPIVGFRRFGWKGVVSALAIGFLFAGFAWTTSGYLQGRVNRSVIELREYRDTGQETSSTAIRANLMRLSLRFIADAPLFGHGTGSIPLLFRLAAQDQENRISTIESVNPHNQIFAIAIQLGFFGALILCAMWIAHIKMFTGAGIAASIGMLIVVQNICSSLFNNHIADFGQGWLYVFGVGVLGGMKRRQDDSRWGEQPIDKRAGSA